MPADSEPSARPPGGAPVVSLPHTFRPFGVRIAIYGLGALLTLTAVVMWFAFPPHIRAQFTFLQVVTVIGLGLMFYAVGYALARSRVVAREEGLKVVNGYTGTKDIILAMQRGEVDASCGLFESAMRVGYLDDIKAGSLGLFVQTAADEFSPFFPEATPVMSVMKDDAMRKLARLVFSPATVTRPLAAPPATPK